MLTDGLEWITFGLLWCFYQLFGHSFWRHPFTAEHPFLRQWYNATFLQIWWRNKLIYILDGLKGRTFSANISSSHYPQERQLSVWNCFTNQYCNGKMLILCFNKSEHANLHIISNCTVLKQKFLYSETVTNGIIFLWNIWRPRQFRQHLRIHSVCIQP